MKRYILSSRVLAAALASALMLVCFSSCSYDDSFLRGSIDDLTSRVEALEDFQKEVQEEIDSLQELIRKIQSQKTVDRVEQNADGSWTIYFSDSTEVTIRDGKDGEDGEDALTPPTIIVILDDSDGIYYWGYEYPDGKTDYIYGENGERFPVTGTAPQVRINPDSGNWEISTDGGKTWTDTGMPSSGVGDSLFEDVSDDEDYVYVTLRGGEVLMIPKTKELVFDFGTDADTVYFAAGESKSFAYTMSGAGDYSISKPDGWRVSMEGGEITITAPVAENVYAETEGVVSVILIASNGQSFLAEQQVKVGEEPGLPAPEIGDYFYSDGTWSSEFDPAKTVLGLVFMTGDSDRWGVAETEAGYVNGLVISVKNAAISVNWSTFREDIPELENTYMDMFYTDLSGLYNCNVVWNREDYSTTNYKAFSAVAAWNEEGSPYKAPENTSGWFLPSSGQVYDLFKNFGQLTGLEDAERSGHNYSWEGTGYRDFADRLNAWMSEIPDDMKDIFMPSGSAEHLWTSTEVFDSNARAWGIYSVGTIECEACGKTWDVDMKVRPVLAF